MECIFNEGDDFPNKGKNHSNLSGCDLLICTRR